MGVEAPQAIFIDDFTINIEGALAAGLNAIQFETMDQVKTALATQFQICLG